MNKRPVSKHNASPVFGNGQKRKVNISGNHLFSPISEITAVH